MDKLDKIASHVRFLQCRSCFWCASALAGRVVEKCPTCSGILGSARINYRWSTQFKKALLWLAV